MSDTFRAQIYNNLITKDTEELLEIWQSGDTSEWQEEVFEIIKEILVKRLGYVPQQSNEMQVLQILGNVEKHIDNNELDKALSECELAIQLDPNSAIAYSYCGEIYDQMGQPENAITSYQKAIQLDPELKDTWGNMLAIETEIEEEFEKSLTKKHLDQALEYAYGNEPELATQECEAAMSAMPSIAIAYNYLGMVLQMVDRLEPAIDSYLKAIELNPRFYPARENLANARVLWEEEQYLRVTNLVLDANEGESETNTETEIDAFSELEIVDGENPIPGWIYLDANAFLLRGWPGYRNRPGRSGYDPLERDFEFAHILGVSIRELFDGKYRTKNPIYLFLIICAGLLFCSPLLVLTTLHQLDLNGILMTLQYVITSSVYWMTGIALLTNGILSVQPSSQNRDGV